MANRLNVANIGYNDATDALTIDSSGNVTAAGTLSAGTISEAVADAGVSIDGVVAKDSKVFAPSGIVFASAEITGDDAGTTNRVESSNLLDDYEEGTWTPGVIGGSGTTASSSYGKYTKVGDTVYVSAELTLSAPNLDYSSVRITLPFNAANITQVGGGAVTYTNATQVSWIHVAVIPNTNYTYFYCINGSSWGQLEYNGRTPQLGNGKTIKFVAQYTAA